MSAINSELFKKFRRVARNKDEISSGLEVEVREDEEQSVKLQEIIDLLVAAGYFRARIKGLSSFDKVVGGMTWCIESCNVDVNVDLLFQENSTIGQKIALTEKIVAVLPTLKCPHTIEPHQIQGLDFINIFPVMQWLVRRSVEFRQEEFKSVRSYAVNQFEKQFKIATKQEEIQAEILKNIHKVEEVYKPRRFYKRTNPPPSDFESRIQLTLLEYGLGIFRGIGNTDTANKNDVDSHEEKIEGLLSSMSTAREDFQELTEDDLKKLAKHYNSLQLEFKSGGPVSKVEKQISTLQEQAKTLAEKNAKFASEKEELERSLSEKLSKLEELKSQVGEVELNLKKLQQAETGDPKYIKEVEDLVIINDGLKSQEIQFREFCKKELVNLKNKIEEKRNYKPLEKNDEELLKKSELLSEEVRVARLKLAKKNRIVASLKRQLDDVPNRPELAQYQRRFLELYNQVSAKHKETKQYFTLYNTLQDTRLYMEKELNLLNSISDSYPEAMESSSGKEEFLKQFQNIVEGIKMSKRKVESKLSEEHKKRDELSQSLHVLIELQRKYVAAVRQLSIELKKIESITNNN